MDRRWRRGAAPLLAVAAGAVLAAPLALAAAVGASAAYRVYHPRRQRSARTPAEDGLTTGSIRLEASYDGVPLAAWVVPGRGPNTVVVCHGMGRNRSSVLGHIRALHRAGHHVVAYDLRNHGDSGADRAYGRMADRFDSDLRDVIHHVRTDPELRAGQVAVLAFSFSTWPAVHVLVQVDPPLSALVCDSGPAADIGDCLRRVMNLRRRSLPKLAQREPVFQMCRLAFELFGRHMLGVKGWPPDLEDVPTRLLFIAGARDPVIPAQVVTSFADRYQHAGWWVAPRAMHSNAIRVDRKDYLERLTTFLDGAFTEGDNRHEQAARG